MQQEAELQVTILDQCEEAIKKDRVQLARLRHAWASCVQFKKSREADDKLLLQSDLQALKLAFFQRYHIKFPPKLTRE